MSNTYTEQQATGRMARRGLFGLMSRHALLFDIIVALLYVVLLLPGLLHNLVFNVGTGNAGIGLAITIGAGVALIFRRRAPLAVLAIVLVLLLIVKTLLLGFTDPIGLAIAGYAIGAYLPPRRALVAVPVTTSVVILSIMVGVQLSSKGASADSLLTLTLMLFVPTCLTGLLVNFIGRLRKAEELRIIHDTQEKIQAAELEAIQQRAVLSREMHDVVGHSLTAIINLSDGALRVSATSPDMLETGLLRINSIARDALGETRTILDTLRPDGETAPRVPTQPNISVIQPPPGVDLGIQGLLDTAESTGLSTNLQILGDPTSTVGDKTCGTIYRIAQEAITNAMRHARDANKLTVTLTYRDDGLTLQVHDNGKLSTKTTGGNGLRGAAERVAGLNGDLHYGSAPTGGWYVTATIPTVTGEVA